MWVERGKRKPHLYRFHLQLQRGILIADDHGVRMQLQTGQRPHVVDPVFHAVLQGGGLARAEHHDDDLARVEDRLHADRQGHLGHEGGVVAEEAAVGQHRVVGERLDAGARRQARARLVEGDMAVLADASQKEIDASDCFDLCLVLHTLGLEVLCVAVEDVHVARMDVDVGEEVLPHEGVLSVMPLD